MPSENLKISDLGEKKLIKRLLSRSQKFIFKSDFIDEFFDENSLKSLRDDAALLNFGKKYLVATSDLLFKSTHFPPQMTAQQIGQKLVTVNVSDLAAMGAEPLGIIIALGLPGDLPLSYFDALVEGILQAGHKYKMALIGGDTNQSTELTLCGTCLGTVDKDKVLTKDGAKPGDIVAVTGPLGLAAAGFELLFNHADKFKDLNSDFKEQALKNALEPQARVEEGILLGKTQAVTSATDITDGLLGELGEILDNNQESIGVTLYEDLLPIPEEIYEVASLIGKDPLEMALSYGEDFELLLTIKKDEFNKIKDQFKLYRIGCVDRSGKISMINKAGKTDILVPKGYEHFKTG